MCTFYRRTHNSPPPPGKVFMQYLYPGGDPHKFGSMELPQVRFLLKQGQIPTPATPLSSVGRDTPHDTDTVKSVDTLESVNRR